MGESTHSLPGIPPSHPAVAGHFPGNPIVPGAVILARVLECLAPGRPTEGSAIEFTEVKFLYPLRPEAPFSIRPSHETDHDVAFTVTSGSTRIASGALRRHRIPAPDVVP